MFFSMSLQYQITNPLCITIPWFEAYFVLEGIVCTEKQNMSVVL
jgi:hypothetical protein